MKKFIFAFILLPLSWQWLSAQEYQTVSSGRTALFANEYGSISAIRIDSVESFQGDSVFYPFSNIQQIEYDCFTPYGASWIGYKIICGHDGYDIILNQVHDSVKIKVNAIPGEKWTAYVFPDSSVAEASLVKLDSITILGLPDSAKTISFQVFDKNSNPLNHKLNSMSVILSKNHGLVKTLNFSFFPDFESNYFYNNQLQEYILVGLSNPELRIQNLRWFDANDFKPGDEVHTSYLSKTWFVPEYVIENSKNTIFKYLERSDFSDSIVYIIDRTQGRRETSASGFDNFFLHDTIKMVISPRPDFEKLPGEIIFSENNTKTNRMSLAPFISKAEPSVYNTFYHSFDSCWSNCCADGCFPEFIYYKGLGGPYYECTNAFSGGGEENKLVYFKKGDETWGTPLVITTVNENCIKEDFKVYPNPAKGQVFIDIRNSSFPIVVEFIDIDGKIKLTGMLNSASSSIDVKILPAGIYVCRLSKNGHKIGASKLIIE